MGLKVILTQYAIDDLREITEFIAIDNPARAVLFAEELIQRALAAGEHPKAGRIVPEISDTAVRELIHQNYRIIYEIFSDSQVIYVLRFWHAARGEPKLPSQE